MKLLFVRHGETDWNLELRYQGHKDTDLTPKGIQQAERAAEITAEYNPQALYASDLKRTMHTASIIGKVLNMAAKPEPGLREIDFGEWEGLTYPEVKEKYPAEVEIWREAPLQACVPGGEDLRQVLDRVLSAVEKACSSSKGNIVFVTHGGPIRLLLCHIGVEGAMGVYPVRPGSVTVVNYSDGKMDFVKQYYSDTT